MNNLTNNHKCYDENIWTWTIHLYISSTLNLHMHESRGAMSVAIMALTGNVQVRSGLGCFVLVNFLMVCIS